MIPHRSKLLSLMAFLSLMLLFPLTASAHEQRVIGKYTMIVGWSGEPAFTGQVNGLDLRVQNTETTDLILGLEKTLKAEVMFGAQKQPLEIATIFGTPGRYIGRTLPTAAGDYKFRIFGTVEGLQVDQTFDSVDGKFSKVESISALQFPSASDAGAQAQAPSAQAAIQRAQAAETAAASSQTLATVALGVGGLGLLLGIVGMLSSGRRAQA